MKNFDEARLPNAVPNQGVGWRGTLLLAPKASFDSTAVEFDPESLQSWFSFASVATGLRSGALPPFSSTKCGDDPRPESATSKDCRPKKVGLPFA